MLKLIAFAVVSICLISISWGSLRAPHSHGFYRFFAWELLLAHFLLNVDIWFKDPFSLHQIASWILLIISLIPLFFGVRSLRRSGGPKKQRQTETHLLAFEKTTTLVNTGIYRYIRHPLYSSLLFLSWGIYFKDPTWIGGLLAIITTAFLFATAKADELECLRFFGAAYEVYMKATKRFVPFLF